MKQQINLYHPTLRRRRPVFAARSMARGIALAALGLLVLYAYPAWQVAGLARHVEALEWQRAAALGRLAQLEERVPRREPSRLLASEVERLAGEVSRRGELLETFRGRVDDARTGFSEHLAGLARQRVEGLWLTDLAVRDAGSSLELGGSALRPELVPILVQRLAGEPVFEGASFGHLILEREDEAGRRVDFRLRTRSPDS